jgi:hypothetical protein
MYTNETDWYPRTKSKSAVDTAFFSMRIHISKADSVAKTDLNSIVRKTDDDSLSEEDIREAKLLFFDNSTVTSTHRVSRFMHQPAFDGVAIRFTEDWENGGSGHYNSVVDYSPSEKRLYYDCAAEYQERRQVCLAVSRDGGTTWHKPILNVSTFRGSKENNIVFPLSCETGCEDTVESGNVWRDNRPGINEDEKWKLFVLWHGPETHRTGGQHLWLLASADGIRWAPLYDHPSYAGVDDTETTCAGWNSALNKYMVFIRDYTTYSKDMAATYCYDRSKPSGRQVGLCLTANLANLSGTCTCILAANAAQGDPVSYTEDGIPDLDVYTSGATRYGDHVLMFPSFFHHFPSYNNASAAPYPGLDHDGILDIRFMYAQSSAPGAPVYVDALNGHSPFISLSINRCDFRGAPTQFGGWCNPNSTDLQRTTPGTSMSYFSPGLIIDSRQEEIYLFSGAAPYTHGSDGATSPGASSSAIERWKLRFDGFGFLEGEYIFGPAAEIPMVTTSPLLLPRCLGRKNSLELHVNVITSVVGYVKIGLTPSNGSASTDPFNPYSLVASNAIKGNYLRRAASWGQPGSKTWRQTLNDLRGQHVVATVLMPDAKLFSLTARCKSDDEFYSTSPQPPTKLTGEEYLFLDDALIQSSRGVTRTWHTFIKDSSPFFAPPTVGDFPYHSLLPPDATSPEYRLWYDCWGDAWGVCLATSDDGKKWDTPDLGSVKFVGARGPEPRNVVLTRRSSSVKRGVAPKDPVVCTAQAVVNASFPGLSAACRDTSPSLLYTPFDAEQPFKLMTFNYNYDVSTPLLDGYYSAWSKDGVRWSDNAGTNPALPTSGLHGGRNHGDLANAGWDYHTNQSMIAARLEMSAPTEYCRPKPGSLVRCRCVGWAWTSDYRTWAQQPTPILCPDDVDDRWVANVSSLNHTELYSMAPVAYGRGYIGLVWVTRFGAPDAHGKGNNEGTMHLEMAYSGDGLSWKRPDGNVGARKLRPQLIPRGEPGSWDSEMIVSASRPVRHCICENPRLTVDALTCR